MQENRKQKNKYVIIYDDFREQGLTLVKAYIVGRVSRFNNVGSPYYESNKTLSKAMGISESTVKRAIDELVEEGILYRKSLPRKRLLSTKPFNNEVHGEPLVEGHTEPLVEGHGEPHENNNVVGQTPKGFMVNHYKIEDKIEDKIEENPNPKNRSTNLNDLPLDKQVKLLEEALENMNYRHDEDFY